MSANTQTSEIVRAISDGRSIAMSCAAHARNPESGDFGKIAQALDFALPKVAEVIDQRDELLAVLTTITKELRGPDKPYSADSYLPEHFIELAESAIAKVKECEK